MTTRTTPLLHAVIGLCLALSAQRVHGGDEAPSPGGDGIAAKGYLTARYSYVGSSSPATVYSGLGISGSLTLSALSERIVIRYRSRHWMHFERPGNSLLESPFENRNILQTVSLESRDLPLRGLRLKAGRFFPEMDYAASPVIDGGAVAIEGKGFIANLSAGRIVDLWNGKHESSDILIAGQVSYRSGRLRVSAGLQNASALGFDRREVPAGFNLRLHEDLWIESYAGYDFEARELARAGFSIALRRSGGSASLTASRWRNPFDQLVLAEKNRTLSESSPSTGAWVSTYDDIRLSGSFRRGGWGLRGTVAAMAGVRSGWSTSAYLVAPAFFGLNVNAGGQTMRSDYIEFYSLDLLVAKRVGNVALQLQSQTRNYLWLPRPSGSRLTDNYSEISAEYPLGRRLFLSGAAGGFIRTLGDEGFKPQFELRLIARL